MFAGILNQLDDFRYRTLTVGLGHTYTQHATQVYASRYHLVVLGHIAGQRFACQRHRIQRTRTVDDHTIQRHSLARLNNNRIAHLHLVGRYCHLLTPSSFVLTPQCGIVGFYLHQVRNAVAALTLSITLKQLTHLEKQHHKHRLGELCFGPWQETYTQGADGGNTHQEVLVKRLALQQTLSRLLQGIMTYYDIRYQIYQQQLPGFECKLVFYYYRSNQQHGCDNNQPQLFTSVMLVVVLVLMMLIMMCMYTAIFAILFHILIPFYCFALQRYAVFSATWLQIIW